MKQNLINNITALVVDVDCLTIFIALEIRASTFRYTSRFKMSKIQTWSQVCDPYFVVLLLSFLYPILRMLCEQYNSKICGKTLMRMDHTSLKTILWQESQFTSTHFNEENWQYHLSLTCTVDFFPSSIRVSTLKHHLIQVFVMNVM